MIRSAPTGETRASCDPGEVATGGGADTHGFLTLSVPAPSGIGEIPTAWDVDATDAMGVPAMVTAWVVCVS